MKSEKTFGVGITTYNRPEVLKFTMRQFMKTVAIDDHFPFIIVDDHSDEPCPFNGCIRNEQRMGIAKSKNKCLSLLNHCDYIFLFDDDCFPIKPNWWKPFIEGGEHHYALSCEPHFNKIGSDEKHTWWDDAMGCFIMVDQAVLKTVGGFDSAYGLYGYEHCEYTQRIHEAGLTTQKYIQPKEALENIWSMDGRYGHPLYPEWNGASALNEDEKRESVKTNASIYLNRNFKFCPYD
jgi:glycosyltransferase involved in cell wall biosynthesis